MKIAYVMDAVITCGGVIVPFEHVKRLKEKGYDAGIYANGRNQMLETSYNIPVNPITRLEEFGEDDVIVAVWWPQCEELEKYKGRKIQFIQGNDLLAYTGQDWKDKCLAVRKKENWELMAVSKYAGEWTGREFTIIPNGVNDRFFEKHNLERDIDILIEGNYEKNKGIDEAIQLAKKVTTKIAWLGRQTKHEDGIRIFENPSQEEIPKIYQRSKILLKLSESEGFCLPILEAMASGCAVVTKDMGGNDFCKDGENCWIINENDPNLTSYIYYDVLSRRRQDVIENAYKTAQEFKWDNQISKLIEFYDRPTR